jgi:hypothetical protein
MSKYQAKDLFQLQTELVQMKVDMAVNNAIERVLSGIADLKGDIHHLEERFTLVEHQVQSTNSVFKEIRTKFIEYSFKAGWVALAVIASFLLYQLHALLK